ncbi:MAG: hypothetical protein ACRD96_00535, partial [Bryobacteraceae bacterium]
MISRFGWALILPLALEGQSAGVTNAATLARDGTVAPDSIVSLFGQRLATATAEAGRPLPVELGGTTVTVTDSRGVQHRARLLFVSAGQVNAVLPAEAATGAGSVSVRAA